jgi:sugar phosphate isomerase/epimerase
MIRSAVTISLVSQARGGPFVFWDDLPGSIAAAKQCGFDAVEIFAPAPEAVNAHDLRTWLNEADLKLAALGTGAGWVIHKWQLCDASAHQRVKAQDFIRRMIDLGGEFGAPAIIGSMQGRWSDEVNRDQALGYLGEALCSLGEHASQYQTHLIYEPLNRYETNLLQRQEEGANYLAKIGANNVRLLCDLFHMNIEEADLAAALRAANQWVGHVHFVDSNRRAAGFGHIDFAPIAAVLQEINYQGYASAEALSWPDPLTAANKTMETFRKYFGK